MYVTRAILYENLQEQCRAPRSGHAFCASLRSQNAHGYVTRAIFMRKSHFMREFAGKNNAGGQSTNPDLTPAFHLP